MAVHVAGNGAAVVAAHMVVDITAGRGRLGLGFGCCRLPLEAKHLHHVMELFQGILVDVVATQL